MTKFDWQWIVVGLALAAAAGYLARRALGLWQVSRKGRGGTCGSCGNAGDPRNRGTTGFVALDALRKPEATPPDDASIRAANRDS